MLDEIGLFDERFFAYLEDVDLTWRVQWADRKTLFVPIARVLHFHSRTGGEVLFQELASRTQQGLADCQKLSMAADALVSADHFALRPGIDPYTLIWHGDWRPVLGWLAGLAKLAIAMRTHRRERPLRQISDQEMVARMAPLATPWRLWQRYAHLREKGWKEKL